MIPTSAIICLACLASVQAYLQDVDFTQGAGKIQDPSGRSNHDDMLSFYRATSENAVHASLHGLRVSNFTLEEAAETHGKFNLDRLKAILASTAKVTSPNARQPPAFTCESLPAEYDPHFFCSGVVDYAFITPSGVTVDDMELQARQAVLYLTSFINAPCLSDMKKLVCSSLYQPCVAKVVADDPSTFMPTEAPAVALPYVRPCGSLCVAVTHYGNTCGYIIEAFGLARDCLAVDPYTGVMVYDFASTPMSAAQAAGQRNADGTYAVPVCNDLPSSIGVQTVHEPWEEYVGEMCDGITRKLYVPPSSALDGTLAPFLPPGVLQAQIEGTVALYEGLNPAFWPSDCRLARREYMCGAYFSYPYADDSLAMFFGTVYTPSYTHRSVCDHYVNLCPQMIEALPAQCDLVLPSGASVFPRTDQAVFTFDLGWGPMSLITPPHNLTDVTMVLPSECPYGTVIPDDPELAASHGIPNAGTACALSCPPRTLKSAEYDSLNLQRRIAYWFSVIIGLLQIVNLSILKRARQNIFVLCAVVGIFAMSLLIVIQIEVYGGHTETSSCSSNASWYEIQDFGESVGSNLCTIVALFSLYQTAFMYWVFITLSVEIWLRVVRGVKEKDINSWRRYYLTIMGACSLAYALLNTFYGKPDVVGKGIATFTCGWLPNTGDKRFYANTIFEIICFSVAITLFLHVVYVCVKTSLSVVDTEKKPLKKIWKSYSMIFLFLALHLILYSITVFYLHVKLYYVDSPKMADSELAWYTCLFQNFVRSDNEGYLVVCGDVPANRAGFKAYIIEEPIIYFTSLVLLYITLYKEVREFWHAMFLRFLAFAGVRFLALSVLGKHQAGFFTIARNRASSVFSSSGGHSDIEMEEGISSKKETPKPTLASTPAPLNPFAKTGVPRSDSYLPDNYAELQKLDAALSEIATERNSARESEAEHSHQPRFPRACAEGTGDCNVEDIESAQQSRVPSTGSSRRNVNVPDTIHSECDAANNEHSIYTTLPSFNAAAEALVEIAMNEAIARSEAAGRQG